MWNRKQTFTSNSEGSGLVGDPRNLRGMDAGMASVERLRWGSATLEGLRAQYSSRRRQSSRNPKCSFGTQNVEQQTKNSSKDYKIGQVINNKKTRIPLATSPEFTNLILVIKAKWMLSNTAILKKWLKQGGVFLVSYKEYTIL